MIVLIKTLHTIVWAFMVACILAIYAFASSARFGLACLMIGIVLCEVLILVVNRLSCPLTPIAARYTADRRPNFDIYLPEWLAKRNKEIFGALYFGGVLYALAMWLRAA